MLRGIASVERRPCIVDMGHLSYLMDNDIGEYLTVDEAQMNPEVTLKPFQRK